MVNSNDISQMFAAQNSMFLGQRAFSQNIGISTPQMSLGAYGAQQQQSGGGYNFGNGGDMFGPGYGGGNKFAGGLMSAAGTVGGLGAVLALDPVTAGIRGATIAAGSSGGFMGGLSAIARAPMMAMAGGAAAALPMAGLAMAAMHTATSFVHGGQQQGAVNSMLGQNYNFFNPQSRTGSGFTRDDASAIGGSIRQLSHIPEMMSSMGELTQIAGKLKATGVMQGVKDATDFSRRFKEAIGTIRDTAKILGTTMDDATEFFQHSRQAGFLGKSDQLKNALNVQLTSGMTGLSNGQVMAMQASGANMATQIGARRSLGASAVTSMAQNIGAGQRSGAIKDGLIQDITGLDGAEGVQAASEQMTGLMLRMAQSAPGRLMMAGLAKFDENGRAVGLDENLVRHFNSGRISMSDLKSRAGRLTHDQKISFRAREEDLSMSFAGQVGPGGMSRFMGEVLGGKDSEETRALLMKRYGATAGMADLMSQMQGANSESEFGQAAKIRAREVGIRERTDPEAIWKRVKTKMHAATFGHVEEAGAEIQKGLAKAYDEFVDDLVGRHILTLSKDGAEVLSRALSGGSKSGLMDMFEAAHGIKSTGGFGNSLGDSAIAEFARSLGGGTGRLEGSKTRHAYKMTGAGGPEMLRLRMEQLNRGEGTPGMGRVSLAINRIIGEHDDFGSLSDEEKLDYLRSELSSVTGDERKDLEVALKESKGLMGDALTNIIAGAQGAFSNKRNQVNFLKIADPMAAMDAMTSEEIVKKRREAVDNLDKLDLEPGTKMLLKGGGEMKKGLLKSLQNKDVYEALNTRDDGEASRKLREFGLDIPVERIEEFRKAVNDLKKNKTSTTGWFGQGKSLMDVLGDLDFADKAEGGSVLVKTFQAAGSEAIAGGEKFGGEVGKLLSEAGAALGGSASKGLSRQQRAAKMDSAQAKIQEIVKKARDWSSEEKNRLIDHAGSMGAAISRGFEAEGMVGKVFDSKEDLAKKLGISDPDVLVRAGITGTGKVKLTRDMIDKISTAAGGLSLARSIGGGGETSMAGTTDEKMLAALTKMGRNQDLTASVLMAMAAKMEIDSDFINKNQEAMRGGIKVTGEDSK